MPAKFQDIYKQILTPVGLSHTSLKLVARWICRRVIKSFQLSDYENYGGENFVE